MSENRSLWYRLYNGETSFDFIKPFRWAAIGSGALILAGMVSMLISGLNFGIDFRGGTAWEIPTESPSVEETRDVLRPFDLDDAKIQVLGTNIIRVQADPDSSASATDRKAFNEEVATALAEGAGVERDRVSINEVGPSWGEEITDKAVRALIAFLVVITIYISLRFEPKMAFVTLVALLHDILITVGIYALSGFEVTPSTVIAFLTILGFSLYDTVVVFDKVEENTVGLASTGRMTYYDVVNLSMNQTLMRSLNTTFVAVLPVLSILFVGSFLLGATTLQEFGLALLVGLATGAYSSIFIASPLLVFLKEREPRYAAIRQRLEQRGTAGGTLTPAAAAAGTGTIGGEPRDQVPARAAARSGDSPALAPPRTRTGQPPRPRKKGKRR